MMITDKFRNEQGIATRAVNNISEHIQENMQYSGGLHIFGSFP